MRKRIGGLGHGMRNWTFMCSMAALAGMGLSSSGRADQARICEDIGVGDQAGCVAEQHKCETVPDRTNCEFAVVSRLDRCLSDDFLTSCRAASKSVEVICRNPDFDGNDPASIKAWTERIKKYDDTNKAVKQFWENWGRCYDKNNQCNVSRSDVNRCEVVAEEYKRAWADRMEWTRTTTLGQSMERAQGFAAQKNAREYKEAVTDLKGAIDIAEKDLPTNQMAFIHVDPKPLEEAIAKAKKAAGGYQGKARSEMALARCPKGKFEDAGLAKTLRAVGDESRQAQTKGTGLSVKFETFRLLSAPWQEVESVTHKVHEYASAGTCERQTTGTESHCRIVELKFHRAKPAGGSWTSWALDGTGGGDEVLCENINK